MERYGDVDPRLQDKARSYGPASRWAGISANLDEIKVVYTDMDGTMMGPRGCFLCGVRDDFTVRPARALVEMLKLGVDVVPVTGRSAQQMLETTRILGLKNYIAELGVQRFYNFGERVVIDTGAVECEGDNLLEFIRGTGVVEWLLSGYARRIEPHTPWSDFRDCTPLFRGLIDVDEVNALLDRKYPQFTIVDNGVILRTSPTLDVSELHAYHLVPKGVSKQKAAADDMEMRGFRPSQAIAVGDSEADIGFADHVGVFFLVRNGFLANPRLASFVAARGNVVITNDLLNEGWAEAMELAVLGRSVSPPP
jgi:hydroxymethylpyrimidine pyrophosphatase-like HAD family hydrolase